MREIKETDFLSEIGRLTIHFEHLNQEIKNFIYFVYSITNKDIKSKVESLRADGLHKLYIETLEKVDFNFSFLWDKKKFIETTKLDLTKIRDERNSIIHGLCEIRQEKIKIEGNDIESLKENYLRVYNKKLNTKKDYEFNELFLLNLKIIDTHTFIFLTNSELTKKNTRLDFEIFFLKYFQCK